MTDMQRKEIKHHLIEGLYSLNNLSADSCLSVENCPDENDFASQLAQQGVNVAMQRRRMARMGEFENALRRLSETDYGICEECGEEIGLARLKATPAARFCVSCQSALEDGASH
jgi:DnaK suppressor protein